MTAPDYAIPISLTVGKHAALTMVAIAAATGDAAEVPAKLSKPVFGGNLEGFRRVNSTRWGQGQDTTDRGNEGSSSRRYFFFPCMREEWIFRSNMEPPSSTTTTLTS